MPDKGSKDHLKRKKIKEDRGKINKARDKSNNNRKLTPILMLLLIVSGALIGVGQFFDTTTINADIRALGMEAELNSGMSQNGLSYELNIDRSGGGGGGILPGFGAGQVSAFDNISNEASYFEGLGEFQENIGLLLNSYADRFYSISADASGTGDLTQRTWVNISTHTDVIPFWPSGINQDFDIRVELAKRGAAQSVRVDEVQIQLWQDLDTDGLRLQKGQPVWSITPGDDISEEGGVRTYSHSFSLDEYENVVGLLGYVKITFIDKNGNEVDENLISNIAEPDPANNDIPLSMTTNLRIMNSTETTRLAMLLISFPMSMISLAIIIISIILMPIFYKQKYSMKKLAIIIMAAAIIQILAVAFLYLGIDNLVNLLNDSLKADLLENYKWTGTIYLLVLPGVFTGLCSILLMVSARKPRKQKEKEKVEDTFSVISQ